MDQQAVEIAASVKRVLETIPPDVTVVAAAKGRTPAEVKAAIQAGITQRGAQLCPGSAGDDPGSRQQRDLAYDRPFAAEQSENGYAALRPDRDGGLVALG